MFDWLFGRNKYEGPFYYTETNEYGVEREYRVEHNGRIETFPNASYAQWYCDKEGISYDDIQKYGY